MKIRTDIMNKKIEKAANTYDLIYSKNKSGKFKYLPDWLLRQSNRFLQETLSGQVKYQKYKRGSIVFVNFGVNLGYELSGNHFAIVLDKDDNYKNGVVSVLPLSSKQKKHYVSLGPAILNTASQKIINSFDELKLKIDNCADDEDAETKKALLNDLKLIGDVLNRYQNLNKETYAMVENITTISKFRIKKPINKFDPIGKIRVSDMTLNIMDLFIILNYSNLIDCLDDEKLKNKLDNTTNK